MLIIFLVCYKLVKFLFDAPILHEKNSLMRKCWCMFHWLTKQPTYTFRNINNNNKNKTESFPLTLSEHHLYVWGLDSLKRICDVVFSRLTLNVLLNIIRSQD